MVRLLSRLSLTLLLVAGTLVLAACPTRTSIEKIHRDPGRYAGREVAIGGRVSNSFGALGTGVYQVDDGTGQMWVYSQRYGVPGNGARVGVRGNGLAGIQFRRPQLRSRSEGNRTPPLAQNRVGADASSARPSAARQGFDVSQNHRNQTSFARPPGRGRPGLRGRCIWLISFDAEGWRPTWDPVAPVIL